MIYWSDISRFHGDIRGWLNIEFNLKPKAKSSCLLMKMLATWTQLSVFVVDGGGGCPMNC